MNLYEVFSNENQMLLKDAVISFENREYNDETKSIYKRA